MFPCYYCHAANGAHDPKGPLASIIALPNVLTEVNNVIQLAR